MAIPDDSTSVNFSAHIHKTQNSMGTDDNVMMIMPLLCQDISQRLLFAPFTRHVFGLLWAFGKLRARKHKREILTDFLYGESVI